MSNKTQELLSQAKEMNNPDLADAIEALEFLKGEATANHQEYQILVDLVEMAKVDKGSLKKDGKNTIDPDAKDGSDDDKDQDDTKLDDADDADGSDNSKKEEPKPKLSYAGIKMIGSFWYSKADNYNKRFSTADECAEYHNSK